MLLLIIFFSCGKNTKKEEIKEKELSYLASGTQQMIDSLSIIYSKTNFWKHPYASVESADLIEKKINELRQRAFGSTSGDITSSDLDLEFILNERSKELYWEGLRRTDLIRFNKFTSGSYLWPFKGDVEIGASVSDFRNVFPIPNNVISVNPNLTQNEGY